MAVPSKDRPSLYARVTDQIVRAIEAGTGDWVMPWHAEEEVLRLPINVATGKHYRGVNVLSLWSASRFCGYPEPLWGTFRQWAERKKFVRKGEQSAIAVFWKPLDPNEQVPDQAEETETGSARRWVLRYFPVFNAAQTEGYVAPHLPDLPVPQRIERAERFFSATSAQVRHGGNRAYYSSDSDYIQMPPFEAFPDPLNYYSTRGHETIHWTGANSRLARDLSGRFGTESYAAEELIAELGAAFLAADLELSLEPREDHAAYIQSWLQILKADNRAIFAAATHAQRAADYLHALQTDLTLQQTSSPGSQARLDYSPSL